MSKAMKDKCGVFGIWGSERAAEYAYYALNEQQHRGEESAGIVSLMDREFNIHRGKGLVNRVFSPRELDKLRGHTAIGHTKYTTQGNSIQPLDGKTRNGPIAVAHNGEISNHEQLRAELENEGHIFSTTSDTEVLLLKFAKSRERTVEGRMLDTFSGVNPSYSVVVLTEDELVGVRDPYGVRPLEIGLLRNGNEETHVFASESVALDAIRAEHIGEVERGEAVIVDDSGLRRVQLFEPEERRACIFEHVYFGHPISSQFGTRVTNSAVRKEFGRQLCREHPAQADVIIAVPDSGNDLALGYSEESGIRFDFGLARSHYLGRTFIQPAQTLRESGVSRKFRPNKNVLNGKKVVLLDDSIVRATTIRQLIKLIRSAGAKEVHARIGSPPYRNICYLGIDTPDKRELIASKIEHIEGIREHIGADSLGYLSKEGMLSNLYLNGGYCTHCFDGIERIARK